MKAVIMAGGKGSRLASVTRNEIPKPMVRIKGLPILEYQINVLKKYGFEEFIIIGGYLHEKIEEYFGNGSRFGISIKYIIETEPLGTGGSLYYLKDDIDDNFLLIYGDILFDVSIKKMIDQHKKNNALVTLFTHPNSHPYDSDLLIVKENKILSFISKKDKKPLYYSNIVNACIYIINKKVLSQIKQPKKMDLENDILFPLCGYTGGIYSYFSPEYVKDIGTPARLKEAELAIKKGILTKKNLDNKQKCIYVDRDGTINKYKGLLKDINEFELEIFVSEAIKMINDSEYLCILITNQPVIARNLCTIEQLEEIHKKMQTLLGNQGVYLDDIFYCPHHPDAGFEGENPIFKISCECRKPRTELIKCSEIKYNIELSKSWIIGDSTVDIQTGINANMQTILIETGLGGSDHKYNAIPKYCCRNLYEATKLILEKGL